MRIDIEVEGTKLNSLSLTFRNKSLETSFTDYFDKSSVNRIRSGILVSLSFWCLILVVIWIENVPYFSKLSFWLAILGGPLYVLLWTLTRLGNYWYLYQPLLISVAGTLCLTTFYYATSYIYEPILVVTSNLIISLLLYQIFPVRFVTAFWSSLSLLVLAISYLRLSTPFQEQQLLFVEMFAAISWIGLTYSGYQRHLSERTTFLLKQKVASANPGSENKGYLDNLTQLFNQRYLVETIKELLSPPISSTFAIAMIDLDNFSVINDQNGQQVGDQVLSEFADIIRDSIRQADIPIRFGGEEFVVLMKDTSIEDAHIVVERMRVKTAAHRFKEVDTPVTFSSGIAIMQNNDLIETALKAAEDKLYKAKDLGRNRTVI